MVALNLERKSLVFTPEEMGFLAHAKHTVGAQGFSQESEIFDDKFHSIQEEPIGSSDYLKYSTEASLVMRGEHCEFPVSLGMVAFASAASQYWIKDQQPWLNRAHPSTVTYASRKLLFDAAKQSIEDLSTIRDTLVSLTP